MTTESLRAETVAVSGRIPRVIRLLVLAAFVVILNETIMVNAIARLSDDLGIAHHVAQWVSTAFMLTMASVIPVTGWFLNRVTTRQAFATAMSIFCTGTAVAGLAPTFEFLLAGRIIQAAGTAVMMPLLMTTLMTVVSEQDRGRVMGNVTMAMSVAPAMGPTVSGVILQMGSWRLLFAVVLPIALLVTWRGLRHLENVGEPQAGHIDWASVALATAGFGGLVYGLSRFESGDVALAAGITATGLAVVATFVWRQLQLQRTGSPLLDLRTLRHRTYAKALGLMAVGFMMMIGAMILLPLYLQEVRGLTPLEAGLLVMPGGLAMGLLGPTVGRLFDRFGGRVLVIPGTFGIVTAMVGLTQVSMSIPYWQVLGLHLVLMVSMASIFTPVFALGLGALPRPLYSHGSSTLGTLQQVSAAFGTALVMTVAAIRADGLAEGGATATIAQLGGMKAAFTVGAAMTLVAVLIAFRMPSRSRAGERPPPDEEDEQAEQDEEDEQAAGLP